VGYTCPNRHPIARTPELGGRVVFLDRDGVLIHDTGYPDDPQAISLLQGVGAALRQLRAAGWRLVVVTNQSGVARGKFTIETLCKVNERLCELLAAEGVQLDALYYCPHHPQATLSDFEVDCDHRKPGAGMLLSAADDLGLDPERCWMVGDRDSDVQAGMAAGCRTVLLGEPSPARSLGDAVSVILLG
jgi:D-glycero-D-manno-heptose 1,7-bisphosphate phosphatase